MGQYWLPATKDSEGKVTLYSNNVKYKDGHEDWNGLKLMEHSWWRNPLCEAISELLFNNPLKVVWCGDYAEDEELKAIGFPSDLYNKNEVVLNEADFDLGNVKYLINHDKKQFADLSEYKDKSGDEGWIIYPISLLTAISNDRGGGDYHENGTCFDKVGHWAGDLIELSNDKPEYEKLDVYFKE